MIGFEGRRHGVLLHPTSLPGRHGIGDLGPEARRFVDWLVSAGASVWQVLPLGPPGGPLDDVPYGSWSALAGNVHLISMDDLLADGLLESEDVIALHAPEGWAHIEQACHYKIGRLGRAVRRLRAGHPLSEALARFREEATWARETARFAVAKAAFAGAPWWQWPKALRDREADALATLERDNPKEMETQVVLQFLFERQWAGLRAYANERGVRILGDLPIYVQADSVDVWAHREGWRITPEGAPLGLAGCPPDVFSEAGQNWDNPVYDWPRMAEDGFSWWRARMKRALEHADLVRLDHFRAFSAFWEIDPAGRGAADGRWVPGPGRALFDALEADLGPLPICVEDLGHVDEDVHALRASLGAPGMRVLQFGFGGEADNPHLLHNITPDCIVYPGNHDTDTSVGWWQTLSEGTRSHAQFYMGRHGEDIAWDLNRAALSSPANLAIIQMQDVLSLGSEARMNDPRSYANPPETWRNWRWRLQPWQASAEVAERLRHLASLYGRAPELRRAT